ncbi:protein translocase subunit SecD [Schaalia canis]|uniref:Protein translocase subunit SecD n=1 Tax=Schaalia canis TaxID=100469 RepID=A0A3P1SG49_9ACTO|nr:protein translocase subunit SecD [Schaalia canis]RRC96261.1 protein translocase subunit SecD [Schaalia canis]
MSSKKRRPVRSLLVLLVAVIASIGALVAGHQTQGASYTPLLALDLEGGTQLILTPVSTAADDREVTEKDIAEAINIIRQRVDASGVAEAEITSLGTSNIVVALPGTPSQETLDLIRSSSQMDFRPVLQVGPAVTTGQQQPAPAIDGAQSGETAQSADSAQSADAIQSATPSDDTAQSAASADSPQSEPSFVPVIASEEEAMQIADVDRDGKLADTPSETPENNSDLKWITEQAVYDFLTLDCTSSEARTKRAVSDPAKPFVTCDADGFTKFILGPVDVSGALLSSASAGMIYNNQGQPTGEWGVDLTFDSEGTAAFAEASKRLYDLQEDQEGGRYGRGAARNHFAAVLDGRIITAPSMNAIIPDGNAQISGSFTPQSAAALANQLNFGSLPLNFEVQSEQQISATLGAEHLEKGIWAGLIGLILVVVYMVWQYRGLALLSASSLLVAGLLTYLVITLLSWLIGYRLSLSGVAGLIVSVGVTADSFIVYFERIRDEVRDGRPLSAAVSEGWDRAKRTILISDAVNLVAAVVLYVLAVGGVQGFAFTLGVTTIVDLVVIFLFTHPMMELLIRLPFFGNGHKLSGLDPEHLGAKTGITYAGRGRVTVREPLRTGEGKRVSLAEQRRQERLAAQAHDASNGSVEEGEK